ncbi:MAG: ABC transporter ATP-binding protein [Acidimicrobiia bacterium]|nr:ABC transporter ATP-binding protein [Acidimicrobiia bacterium]
MPSAPPIAQLSGVGVRFGRIPVLRGIDLEVAPSEVVGVVGPNGSGKSTLLRILATLVKPTVGDATVLGVEVGSDGIRATRHRLALLGHHSALWGELTLLENLTFVARMSGVGTDRVEEILELVGLGGSMGRRADHSSHGMQRRIEFARTLLTRPDLLLLDEAHAGLDKAAQALVELAVSDVRNRAGGVVLVSHEPDRMLPLVDTTYELVNGTLIREGTPE